MASIREIAKYANVSPGTVSRVLNEDPSLSVNPKTRERVRRVAQELNYNKQSRVSRQIQIVTHASKEKEMVDPYYRELRLAIEKEITQLNLTLKKTIRTDELKRLTELSQVEKAGGVIVIGPFQDEVIQKLQQYNTNIVLINQMKQPVYIDAISSDLYQAMTHLLTNLCQHGLSDVCYVGGQTKVRNIGKHHHQMIDDDRQNAYVDWCDKQHIRPHYYKTEWRRESAQDVVKKMMKRDDMPDVIIAGNDMLAVGIVQELQKNQYHVPGDVKVISFNDSEVAQYAVPMLTSVHIPIEEFGRQAVRLIQDRLKGQRQVAIHMTLETTIQYRDSFPNFE
ncbi:LacI family DNA-binding transcriptional regulator [Staphylococcus felis]|uniref:LacI family DNA-binding transcriptional regulator n=1 Tax=Staphylococcus felis TaxID=46127 RepID=UPI000E22E5FE|nr:LacI family DNA-binding transcriptional regulator [Staphylococcus felis]REH77255.1 LacI family transcriptional regulator [Staphylococcus felis]